MTEALSQPPWVELTKSRAIAERSRISLFKYPLTIFSLKARLQGTTSPRMRNLFWDQGLYLSMAGYTCAG